MGEDRELTKAEVKAFKFLRAFERYSDTNRLYAVVYMSHTALDIILDNRVAMPLKVEFDKERKMFKVMFMLPEFRRYTEYIAGSVGVKVELDGTIKTWDNQIIEGDDTNAND